MIDDLGDIMITEDLTILQIVVDKVIMIQTIDIINWLARMHFQNRVVLQDPTPEILIIDRNHQEVIIYVINNQDLHLGNVSAKNDPDLRLDSKHIFKVKNVHHRETKFNVKGSWIQQRRVIKRATRRLRMCQMNLQFNLTYQSLPNHQYQYSHHLHLHSHHLLIAQGNGFNHQLMICNINKLKSNEYTMHT